MDYAPYIKRLREQKAQERALAEKKRQEALRFAKEIAKVLKHDFSARRVMVFGSVLSSEEFHLHSDIDLAVAGIPANKFFAAYGNTLEMAKDFDIEIVDLKNCRPAVKARIEKEGIDL